MEHQPGLAGGAPISRNECESIGRKLPAEEECQALAELFKTFGDPTRIRILFVLSCGEVCVNDLADILAMTASAISHQLRLLKQARLVKNRREGKLIYYSLDDDHVRSMFAQGLEHIQEK